MSRSRGLAIDLGTTNSVVASYDHEEDRPEVLPLDALAWPAAQPEALLSSRVVPSAVELLPPAGVLDRVGRWGPLRAHLFLGRWAHIGFPALQRNQGRPRPGFARSFKRALARAPGQTLARVERQPASARQVAEAFLRELLAAVLEARGARPRQLTFTVPVDAFERYRAELRAMARRLGVRQVEFIDEPVAAALGYGVSIAARRRVLVVDFGGGTLDLAMVVLGGHGALGGSCEVVAKEGLELGGDLVDCWLAEEVCARLDLSPDKLACEPDGGAWLALLRDEARRVKEALYLAPRASFALLPPEELRPFEARLRGEAPLVELGRDELVALLERRGLYRALAQGLERLTAQARARGQDLDAVDDVLMVGGSSLLPQVYSLLEARFGRSRVRAWQPFEAVALGAAAHAAGRDIRDDFIVHDYAVEVHDRATEQRRYPVVIPAGTRFPTALDHWRQLLVPACAQGAPESVFKLVVCEVGRRAGASLGFMWDAVGQLHRLGEDSATRVVLPLNDVNPTLGELRPPHPPGDHRPRLEVALGVDADRWLVATVRDLWTRRTLMRAQAVVRLL